MSRTRVTRVGFIGLGSQGGPMARRIVAAGHPTTLWARRPEALEAFTDTGASFAASPAELAAASDLICVCVVDDDDVVEVVEAMLPSIRPGSIIAVHSTISPATCERLAGRLAEKDASLVDAPVSGGGPAAEAGTLVVMAGGSEEDVTRCRPVFETYGDPVLHVGPLGTALLAKLVNNALMMAHMALADDALALASALGVDRSALTTIISSGSGNSFSFGVLAGLGSIQAFADVAGDLLRKDVGILSEVLTDRGLDPGDLVAVADHGLGRGGRGV
jgi:3-hydroxyisobutyrate dehydrogenase-like beta-hydroxyacid dehydrogenase